jgi:23S rRNA pseudouridine1911/1915/1917 synthase
MSNNPNTQLNQGYSYRLQLGPAAAGLRVLAYLAAHYRHSSQQTWQQRLLAGELTLDGAVLEHDALLKPGQWLVWQRPAWSESLLDAPLALVYQDEALLAYNKPSGLATLPGGGFYQQTLLHHVQTQHPEAHPLHRLGRTTSGLVLFARSSTAARALTAAWNTAAVSKRYWGLAAGWAEHDHYQIEQAIGPVPHPRLGTVHAANDAGKASLSLATVLKRHRHDGRAYTLFAIDIYSGRPHQIRIHLASIGYPLLGDPLYAAGGLPHADNPGLPGDGGYWLHAYQLAFVHPSSGNTIKLEAALPDDWRW